MLETKRLFLRPWQEADAEELYTYAKDPDVGPIAGWPVHENVEDSLGVIKHVLTGAECYAICDKITGKAMGSIELKLNGHTDMTERDDECELGFWIGKPHWGKGYVPVSLMNEIRIGHTNYMTIEQWKEMKDRKD